jgi:hypothetical protein
LRGALLITAGGSLGLSHTRGEKYAGKCKAQKQGQHSFFHNISSFLV